MSAESEQFGVSPSHQVWLTEHNVALHLDNKALQDRARELKAKVDLRPHVYLSDPSLSLPQDRGNLIVEWSVPRQSPDTEKHQLELAQAVDVSLLGIRQEGLRLNVNRLGALMLVGGAIVATVGDRAMGSNLVEWSGTATVIIGGLALGWANTILRSRRTSPLVEAPERPPIQLRSTEDGRTS